MRHFIYIVLITALSGCHSDPETEYLKTSHIFICDQMIYLGEEITDNDISSDSINKARSENTYSISCEKPGVISVGTGQQSQTLLIRDASFQISQDSTVNELMGVWILDYDESPENDLTKVQYEIEQALGKPTSIRPITWEKNGASLILGKHETEYVTMEYVQSKIDS